MNTLTIVNQVVQIKEWDGRRVVTLKDIDAVHQRPEGTARKRFNDNRTHFIEGEDYHKISPSEFRTAMGGEMDSRQMNDITLITESGYLMLVKSFTDDLAWQVQRALVNCYFRVKSETKRRAKPIDIVFRQQLNMARDFSRVTGVSLGIAVSAGIIEAERITGASLDHFKRALPARTDEKPVPELNATALGEIIGLKAAKMNLLLEAAGLQVKPDEKWRLTDKGKQYGEEFPFTKNGHSDYRILWRQEVLDVLEEAAICAD